MQQNFSDGTYFVIQFCSLCTFNDYEGIAWIYFCAENIIIGGGWYTMCVFKLHNNKIRYK